VDVVGSLKIDIATCSLHDVYAPIVRITCPLFSDHVKHGFTSFQVFTGQHFGGERSRRHIDVVVGQMLQQQLLQLLHVGQAICQSIGTVSQGFAYAQSLSSPNVSELQ
jgi:hypothetical protein